MRPVSNFLIMQLSNSREGHLKNLCGQPAFHEYSIPKIVVYGKRKLLYNSWRQILD